MSGIAAGALRLKGGFGIRSISEFSMREYPGEHSRAVVTGVVPNSGSTGLEFEGTIGNSLVEIYAEGEHLPLYSGIVQSAQAKEENGLRLIHLDLASGSILLDMEKKSRSYQNVGMTYGKVIDEALAPWNTTAIYPSNMGGTAIGFPVIQYQETDWEFVKRMASRFALSPYPEPSIGGSKMYVGIPKTGNICELEADEYAVGIDERFYALGGEGAGYNRSQFLCYEVKSLENHRVGDKARFLGEEKYICAKRGSVIHGQMEFTYTLASPAWAGARRQGNRNFSGLSLLGTVSSCSNETVQLKLDIDQGKPEQKLYPFNWVPATGNMMYMMPRKGTRVSLYFKGDEETSAVAVNCIRSGGGCAKSDYRDKGLTTEHGMQLKLYRSNMGLETPANKLLLDDGEGIDISGNRMLNIAAVGDVHIEAKEVCITGSEKVRTYTGTLQLTEDEELEVEVKAKIELSEGDEGQEANIRGEDVTYYLAWEHADLSSPFFRYRDEPEEKAYDWWGLAGNVAGGIAVTAGVALLGAVAAGLVAGTAIGSAVLGGTTAAEAAKAVGVAAFVSGSMYVGTQAVTDALSGRLSSSDTYLRRALAGSIVGIFSGASTLMLADAGLLGVMGGGFAEGFAGEAITQKLLNEDGEINWAQCIRSGVFIAVMDAGLYAMKSTLETKGGKRFKEEKGIEESESLFYHMSREDKKRYIAWEQGRANGITPDNPDAYVRFGYLLDRGVDYDNAYFLATLDRNIYEAFDEDEIVKLITNVEDYASTLSWRKRRPAVAGIYNKRTGEFFYATNLKSIEPPDLAPQLEKFYNNMPLDVFQSYAEQTLGAGTHAEVVALNEALWSDPLASIDDFLVYVIHGDKAQYGIPFQRCPHCQWITQQFYSIYR